MRRRCNDLTVTNVAAIIVRVLLLAWCMGLITYSSVVIYSDLESITGSVAAAYASTLGLMGVVTGFIQKHLEKSLAKITGRPAE